MKRRAVAALPGSRLARRAVVGLCILDAMMDFGAGPRRTAWPTPGCCSRRWRTASLSRPAAAPGTAGAAGARTQGRHSSRAAGQRSVAVPSTKSYLCQRTNRLGVLRAICDGGQYFCSADAQIVHTRLQLQMLAKSLCTSSGFAPRASVASLTKQDGGHIRLAASSLMSLGGGTGTCDVPRLHSWVRTRPM